MKSDIYHLANPTRTTRWFNSWPFFNPPFYSWRSRTHYSPQKRHQQNYYRWSFLRLLVVEFQPIWKICKSQIGSFPQRIGVKIKKQSLKPPPSCFFSTASGAPSSRPHNCWSWSRTWHLLGWTDEQLTSSLIKMVAINVGFVESNILVLYLIYRIYGTWMVYIMYIDPIEMVNVGKYTKHGWYGYVYIIYQ